MKNEFTNGALNVVNDHIVASTVSGGTVLTGIATIFDLLPSALGSVASIIGIILAIAQIRKIRVERRILAEQLRILQEKDG